MDSMRWVGSDRFPRLGSQKKLSDTCPMSAMAGHATEIEMVAWIRGRILGVALTVNDG